MMDTDNEIELIFYIFGFISEHKLINIEKNGFLLFPYSVENIEINLKRFLSNNYQLSVEKLLILFEIEKDLVLLKDKDIRDYSTNYNSYPHKYCESNENFSKVIEIHGVLEEKSENKFKIYDPLPDCTKIQNEIIQQTKTIKDLLLLKVFKLILSDNDQYNPTNSHIDFKDIFKDLEIPEILIDNIADNIAENFKFEQYRKVNLNKLFKKILLEVPHSFIEFYVHDFNSTGCERRDYIIFHQKVTQYFLAFFESINLDSIILDTFSKTLDIFQNKYPTPLFEYREKNFILCNKIFEKWKSSKPIFSFALEDYKTELQDLIKRNFIILIEDQILLKEGNQNKDGLKQFYQSKLYYYSQNLRERENARIEFNKNKFVSKWLYTKILINNDKISFSNDFLKQPSETEDKNQKIVDIAPEFNKILGSKYSTNEEIIIERGGDWKIEGGRSIFEFKVKIENKSNFTATDVHILLTSIPSGLSIQSKTYEIPVLKPGAFESPSFKLIAKESCVGDKINGMVTFTDHKGNHNKKLDLKPFEIRYVCNLLTPKEVSREYFNKTTEFMEEKKKTIESDLDIDALSEIIITKFKECNFAMMKDIKQSQQTSFTKFQGFAQGLYDHQDVALTVAVKKIEGGSKLIVKAYSDRYEKIIDLLKDFSIKLDDIKSDTELIKEYSPIIDEIFERTNDIELFMRDSLTSDFEKIKLDFDRCRNDEISKKEFMKRGLTILGKNFLKKIVEKFSPFKMEA